MPFLDRLEPSQQAAGAAELAAVAMVRGAETHVSAWLVVAPELTVIAALYAIAGWQPEVEGKGFVRVLVVAWGSTAFGLGHLVAEYLLMGVFSDANWDVPPLTGSVTVATLVVSAVLTLVWTLRPSPVRPGAENGPARGTLVVPSRLDTSERRSPADPLDQLAPGDVSS